MPLDIANILKDDLGQVLTRAIENNDILKQNDGIKKIINWYDKSESKQDKSNPITDKISEGLDLASLILSTKHDKDKFFSKLSTMLVTKLLENVHLEFAKIMINNIKIQTVGKEHGLKFDFESDLEPIRPFIEFVKKVNEVPIDSTKIRFQINSKININGVEIMSSQTERRINLGRLVAKITISIDDTNIPILGGPKKLLDSTFKSDLSKFHILTKTESESKQITCRCGHGNLPETKYCGMCGRQIQ